MKITKDALILAQALGGGGGITPTGNQDITTLNEYDVTDKATARVSAAERAKIIPENIKSGETILGVEGTYSGGGASAPSNDVNFYDYDGTIVYSYSAADFANFSAMPANPTHEGLTAQGWNWSLADAKTYVASYGILDIGQMYITDDGKTRLYITIATTGRMSPTLYFSQTVANGVTIDWGDNSATETVAGTGNKNPSHTYAAIGDYVITLNPAEGCSLGLGFNTSSSSVISGSGSNINPQLVYRNALHRVEIGKNVTAINNYAFSYCRSLATITLPKAITSIGDSAFSSAMALKHITVPDAVATIGASAFDSTDLFKAMFPKSVSSIGIGAYANCYRLVSLCLPDGITAIANSIVQNGYAIPSIIIPKSITSIGTSAFSGLYGAAKYDFSNFTSIPTLSSTNAFNSIPADCQILVPAALYDTWKAASNWSNYASKMVAV